MVGLAAVSLLMIAAVHRVRESAPPPAATPAPEDA